MATLSIQYGTATTIAFTASAILSDTARATGRASAPFSNATRLFIDLLLSGNIKLATGLTNNTVVEIWCAGSFGNASQLTAGCPTAEGAFTPLGEKALMQLVTVLTVTASATANERAHDFGPISIASLFGGSLPQDMAFAVFHDTGVALASSTATSHFFQLQGINYTSA